MAISEHDRHQQAEHRDNNHVHVIGQSFILELDIIFRDCSSCGACVQNGANHC